MSHSASSLVPDEKVTAASSRLTAPREEVRQALLDAVGLLIRRYGYRKTSVEDIAREAGVSRATAYLYFSGKEELVLSWIARGDRQKLEQLRELSTLPHKTAPERVASLLLARVMIRFDNAQPYTESIDELVAALRPQVLTHRDQQQEAESRLIAEVLGEGVQNDEFRFLPDVLGTARLLITGTNSLLPYSLSAQQLGERDSVESRARGLIGLLLGGLLPEVPPYSLTF